MTPADVLSFWFGPADPAHPHGESRAAWWKKDPAFDEQIRDRFGAAVEDASQGRLGDWAQTPSGALAQIILLDQFSRNLFRGDPLTWAQDGRCQELCLAALDRGDDQKLPHLRRLFLYMPLMHAEDAGMQERCVALFDALPKDAPAELKQTLSGNLRFAEIHRDIVVRFGRFPHRNAILGRESTPEEIAFLNEPDSSF